MYGGWAPTGGRFMGFGVVAAGLDRYHLAFLSLLAGITLFLLIMLVNAAWDWALTLRTRRKRRDTQTANSTSLASLPCHPPPVRPNFPLAPWVFGSRPPYGAGIASVDPARLRRAKHPPRGFLDRPKL